MTATGVEHDGVVRTFPATILNVSLSGVLLEAEITANLWADKQLTIELPGGVGSTTAAVRRFVAYGDDTHKTSRWGVELTHLTIAQRALWGRFVYTAARVRPRPRRPGRPRRLHARAGNAPARPHPPATLRLAGQASGHHGEAPGAYDGRGLGSCVATTSREGGFLTGQGFYVQVRYPDGKRWVAVAASQDRRTAIHLGARAYRHRVDERGKSATAVRVVSIDDLETEGGQEAVSRAALDMWEHDPGAP